MAPQDSFIDDEEDTWYVYSQTTSCSFCTYKPVIDKRLTFHTKPSVHRRIRSCRQKLQAMSMWIPGRSFVGKRLIPTLEHVADGF